MRFVLRMAGREVRASWPRLLFFFLCVAIGVGAIIALRSVVQNVRYALQKEARTLLAADVLVQTNRPWDPETRRAIEGRLASAPVLARTEFIETPTMVRPADERKLGVRMVELQGVQPEFPLYGTVKLDGGTLYTHELLRGQGALVRPELLTQLDLRVGDALLVGDARFTIRGVVVEEPGRRVGAFSFGSRVLVDYADLGRTGLLRFGSRARNVLLLRVAEPGIEPLVRDLRAQFRPKFVSVRSYRGTEDDIGEDLQRAEDYLSLVGFVILVLGGVGVWSVTRVFVRQKIRNIAVLKCLGAGGRTVLAVYVVQVFLLALAGSLTGVLLAWIGLSAIPARLLSGFAGTRPALTVSAVSQGIGVGLLVSLLFSLVPLLDIRGVKPLLLLRDPSAFAEAVRPPVRGLRQRWARVRAAVRHADWPRILTAVTVAGALVAVASWQAASLRVGMFVSAGFVAVAFALHLAGLVLVRLVRPLHAVKWFPLRHAVLGFGRPGNQTSVILLVVGLGAFFIIGVRSLQANLLHEFSVDMQGDGPDLFLIDIQPDQATNVSSFLAGSAAVRSARLLPVLRARITGVKGRSVNLDSFEDVRGRGSLAREYVITYRGRLEANERLVEGRFWDGTPSQAAEVSIEESIRDRFEIAIGDTIRFDILGRVIEARVTSVRRVEWRDARSGGFMFVFRPGVLERAPQTYIALVRGPADTIGRATLQRDLVRRFSNVSVIDIREVARTVQQVLGNVTLAISVVGAVALLSGLLILVGSVAMTKFQRLHEAAVFKTLGASTRTVAAMLALEYGTLGALAGGVGAVASIALSWVVSRQVLNIRWEPTPGIWLAGLVLTSTLVGALGVVASLDVLRRKPLSILRAE